MTHLRSSAQRHRSGSSRGSLAGGARVAIVLVGALIMWLAALVPAEADFPEEESATAPPNWCTPSEQRVVYKRFGGGDTPIRLEVYEPSTGTPPFPGVVLIHGGAFSHGDKCLTNVVNIAENIRIRGSSSRRSTTG